MANAKPSAREDVPDWVGALMRTCIGCGKTDNHPKIVKATMGAADADIYWHHDCYVIAKAGYDWPEIAQLLEGAKDATGHQLRMHIMRATGQEIPEE
jgi:hypothetical protein